MKTGILLLIILLSIGLFVLYTKGFFTGGKQSTVTIEDKVTFDLEVVSDPVSQARGLSGRESLPIDTGMLFVFSRPKIQRFWMKDMHFPLDILWIRDFHIIGISENIPHPDKNDGETARMSSPEPADMVLELNAGLVQTYGLEVGDMLNISLK